LNEDKSNNKLSERMEAIESQDSINKDQIDSDQMARQKYEEYREHWYFHKSSWYVRGLNAYDGHGCNQLLVVSQNASSMQLRGSYQRMRD
jgi:hypothetical protein